MNQAPRYEILAGYMEEVASYVPALFRGIESLRKNPRDSQTLEEMYRLVHTIKGASAMVGIRGLSAIAYRMETALERVIAGRLVVNADLLRVLTQTVERFLIYCEDYLESGVPARKLLQETTDAFRKLERHAGFSPTAKPDPAPIQEIPAHESARSAAPPKAAPPPKPRKAAKTVSPKTDPEDADMTEALMDDFRDEAEDHLREVETCTRALRGRVSETTRIRDPERNLLRRIRRAIHTLKGAAAVLGVNDLAKWAHGMADFLDWLFEEADRLEPAFLDALAGGVELLSQAVETPRVLAGKRAQSIAAVYRTVVDQSRGATPEGGPAIPAEEKSVEKPPVSPPPAVSGDDTAAEATSDAADPFQIRTLRVDMNRIDGIVNLTGELMIALGAFDQRMERFRETVRELEINRERLRQIAREMEIGFEVQSLQRLSVAAGAEGEAAVTGFDPLEFDRYSELNRIIRGLNESVIDLGTIERQFASLAGDFDGDVNRERVILSELQEKVMRTRMTPMSTIVPRFHRTVREVADMLGKRIHLEITGDEVELDRQIWEKMADPLMHLLRNASDHGIETPEYRTDRGKPPVGLIRLSAAQEGSRVVIRVSDDGAGIDVDAVRRAAQKRGLAAGDDDVTEERLTEFLFHPGFSTRETISAVSGRGVGMDVVRENLRELKGSIRISSQKGEGAVFTLRIPLTMAAARALLFRVSGRLYALALTDVSEIVRVETCDLLGTPSPAVRIDGEIIPLRYLSAQLRRPSDPPPPEPADQPLILVVRKSGGPGALLIDALVSQQEIVIKSTGSHLRNVRGVSGATILGDGGVVPILNVEDLFGEREPTSVVTEADLGEKRPPTVMIVDDSVSIRRTVERLVNAQGWRARTAKDGIEALERLSEGKPDIIILDLEMPRMNGYEYLAALRNDTEYQDIPVVVLTSRTAAKHRDKALNLGARAFVIKPYKEEAFVELIRSLANI